ncbi:MAG: hypothetical protein U0872_14975 [Planctomycetaceae bacterium]
MTEAETLTARVASAAAIKSVSTFVDSQGIDVSPVRRGSEQHPADAIFVALLAAVQHGQTQSSQTHGPPEQHSQSAGQLQ